MISQKSQQSKQSWLGDELGLTSTPIFHAIGFGVLLPPPHSSKHGAMDTRVSKSLSSILSPHRNSISISLLHFR